MNDNKFYCMNCGFVEKYEIKNKTKTYEINGENITCEVKVKICPTCGEELSGKGIIDEELKIFREEYKKKNNLLTSDEIKEIRKLLGMTQKEFANYLGFGEKTITRYELGQIQEIANDNLMRLALSNDTITLVLKKRKLFNTTENKLKSYSYKKCKNKHKPEWNKQNTRRNVYDCYVGVA